MKARVSGAVFAASDAAVATTVSLPRGLERRPQVMSYVPGFSRSARVELSPGAMFSRSATTITPSRISHSSGRSEALWMRKVVRPAGTVSSAGSQVASVTVTAISPGTGSGRLLRAASQKAASPAATRRPAPARARLVVRRETGRGVAAMAQVSLSRRLRGGLRAEEEEERHAEHERPDDDLTEDRGVVIAEEAAQDGAEDAS